MSSHYGVGNGSGTKAAGVSLSSPLRFPSGESAKGSPLPVSREEPYRHSRVDYLDIANWVSWRPKKSSAADLNGAPSGRDTKVADQALAPNKSSNGPAGLVGSKPGAAQALHRRRCEWHRYRTSVGGASKHTDFFIPITERQLDSAFARSLLSLHRTLSLFFSALSFLEGDTGGEFEVSPSLLRYASKPRRAPITRRGYLPAPVDTARARRHAGNGVRPLRAVPQECENR